MDIQLEHVEARHVRGQFVHGLLAARITITCVEIDQCVGCHRAVRNRHRHAIEQAPRRWRGTRRKMLLSTQTITDPAAAARHRQPITLDGDAVGLRGGRQLDGALLLVGEVLRVLVGRELGLVNPIFREVGQVDAVVTRGREAELLELRRDARRQLVVGVVAERDEGDSRALVGLRVVLGVAVK